MLKQQFPPNHTSGQPQKEERVNEYMRSAGKVRLSPTLAKTKIQTHLRTKISNTNTLEEMERACNSLDWFPQWQKEKLTHTLRERIKRRRATHRLKATVDK